MVGSSDTRSRRGVVSAVIARWKLVVVLAALGLAIGLSLVPLLPRQFSSTTSLIVNPTLGNAFAPTSAGQSLDNIATEILVVASSPVAAMVGDALGGDVDTEALRRGVSVSQVPNSQVLEVTYTGSNPDDTREVADAFATSYLAFRAQIAESSTQAQLDSLDEGAEEARTAINTAVQTLRTADEGSQQFREAEARVQSATDTLTALETEADQIRLSRSDPGQVLSAAQYGRASQSSVALAIPAFGALGGGLLGAVVAVSMPRRRNRRDVAARELSDRELPVIGKGGAAVGERDPDGTLATQVRRVMGPDRRVLLLTGLGSVADQVGVAELLVGQLREESVRASLLTLTGQGQQSELSTTGRDAHLAGSRIEPAVLEQVLRETLAEAELVVVAAPRLTQAAALDALAVVPDSALVVDPVGDATDKVVEAAEQVRLYHGNVLAVVLR